MYEEFLGLDRRPFASLPDPDCPVETPTLRAARELLERSVDEGGGIALVVAPPGLGKSDLCQRLARLPEDRFRVAHVPTANFLASRAMLQALLHELGRPYSRRTEQELRLELADTIRRFGGEGRRTVLVLDEAHLLGPRLLEELRLLVQLQEGARPLVAIVLAGQPALEETLAEPGLEAFNHRIDAQAYLERLSRDESRTYVAARLAWAGGDAAACLDDEALAFVCQVADGSPRALHQIVDRTLLLAFAHERRPADLALARLAYEDVRRLPLHWNEPPAALDSACEPVDEVEDEVERDELVASHSGETTDLETADDSGCDIRAAIQEPAAVAFEFGWTPADSMASSGVEVHAAVAAEPDAEGFFELALAPLDSPHDAAPRAAETSARAGDVSLEECRSMSATAESRVASVFDRFDAPIAWSEESRVAERAALDRRSLPSRGVSTIRPAAAAVGHAEVDPADEAWPADAEPCIAPLTEEPVSAVEFGGTGYDYWTVDRTRPLLAAALGPIVGRVEAHVEQAAETAHAAKRAERTASPCDDESESASIECWDADLVALEDRVERQVDEIRSEAAQAVAPPRRTPRAGYDVVELEPEATTIRSRPDRPYARLFSEIRRQWSETAR